MKSVSIRIDIGGADYIPHTFFVVTDENDSMIEYGLVPDNHLKASAYGVAGAGKIDVNMIDISGKFHESTVKSPAQPLSDTQYNKLMEYINKSIDNPPDYLLIGKSFSSKKNNCSNWAVSAWKYAELPNIFGVTNSWAWNPYGQGLLMAVSNVIGSTPDPLAKINNNVDPLILDLNGDGIKILPLSAGVLFDADGDGIKTNTAWVDPHDAILVLDRNKNGVIDSGQELFGDETFLLNGKKSTNGFVALSELDTGSVINGKIIGAKDGVFNALDDLYTNVQIWQDLNSDGISQANELKTLLENNIVSIQLNSQETTVYYADALLTHSALFTRTDGSHGQIASFILSQNNFVHTFNPVVLSEASQSILDIKGSGWVRGLQEAATLNPDLISLFYKVKEAPTREAFKHNLEEFLREWGLSSEYISASKLAEIAGYTLILSDPKDEQERSWMHVAIKANEAERDAFCTTLSDADLIKFKMMRESMLGGLEKLHVYEAFSGHTFLQWDRVYADAMLKIPRPIAPFEINDKVSLTRILHVSQNAFLSSEAGYIRVNMPIVSKNCTPIDFLWERLINDASDNLMPSLYLLKYFNEVKVNFDVNDAKINFDFTHLDVSEDPVSFLDLYRSYGKQLMQMGCNKIDHLQVLIQKSLTDVTVADAFKLAGFNVLTVPSTAGTEVNDVFAGDQGANVFNGREGNDLIDGGGGNDHLLGGNGDDLIFGGTGNDSLFGEEGDDILDGGPGNDMLNGGPGNDIYLFGLGDGQDMIAADNHDDNMNKHKLNILQFKEGISPLDIKITRSGIDLILSVIGTTDKITISHFFFQNKSNNAFNPVQQVKFSDDTLWNILELEQKLNQNSTSLKFSDMLSFKANHNLDVLSNIPDVYVNNGLTNLSLLNHIPENEAMYSQNIWQ